MQAASCWRFAMVIPLIYWLSGYSNHALNVSASTRPGAMFSCCTAFMPVAWRRLRLRCAEWRHPAAC